MWRYVELYTTPCREVGVGDTIHLRANRFTHLTWRTMEVTGWRDHDSCKPCLVYKVNVQEHSDEFHPNHMQEVDCCSCIYHDLPQISKVLLRVHNATDC